MNDTQIKNHIVTAKRELYDSYRQELLSNERRLTDAITKLERKIDALNEQYTNDIQTLQNHIDHLQDRLNAYDSQTELNDTVKSIAQQHKQQILKSKIKQNLDEQNIIDETWNALKNNEPI